MRWRSDENVLSGSNNKKNGNRGSESDNEGSNYHNNINNNNNKPDPGAALGVWRSKKQKWVKFTKILIFLPKQPSGLKEHSQYLSSKIIFKM